jgi:hypothetical protein
MGRILLIIAYITVIPAAAIGWLGFAFWLSLELHEFGPWDPRYLLLFHGTDVERLDLVEPVSGSIRYAGQGQEGTAPARAFVSYKTAETPERIIEIYKARCSAIGLVPSERDKLGLRCTREASELGIGAKRTDGFTEVTIGGWEFE